MPDQNDTVEELEVQDAETSVEVIGTPESSDTSSDTPAVEEQKSTVDVEELERLRKERDQAQMRANQLENEAKKAAREREAAEMAKLRESGDKDALLERLLREKEEQEAKEAAEAQRIADERAATEQEQQIEALRESVLKDFPEDVQKMAKTLNLYWDNADSEETAKESLRAKLVTLQSSLPSSEDVAPEIHANNPSADVDGVPLESLSLEELRKVLPRAESR